MLCFKRKNFVVSVLLVFSTIKCFLVGGLNFFNTLVDFATITFVDTVLVSELLTPNINVVTE
jgi:hypothetical protein